jgi:hypothetical protein
VDHHALLLITKETTTMLRLAMVNPRTTYPALVGALAFFAGAFGTYTTLRFANTKDAG